MRILQVDDTLTLAGGVGQYVAALVDLLARGGHESITVRCRGAEHAGGYRVDHTLAGHDAAARLQDIVRRERPDVALVHHVADAAVISALTSTLPTVAYVHGYPALCPGLAKYYRRGDEVCLRAFGWGCFPMHYLRRCSSARNPRTVLRLMAATRRLQGALRRVPQLLVGSRYMAALLAQNGFDLARSTILPPHFIAAQPAPWTPPADPDQILYAGRLEIEKGVPYLLEALALLPRRYHLVIAGDGTLRAVYEQMTARLGLSDRVRFLGWCNQAAMPALYRQSGLLALPTICPESFGKVGIEAMAEGRPVVAFDSGGVSDWLRDGETGLLVRTRKGDALAQALDAILSDPVGAERMGSAAQEAVATAYDPASHVSRLLAVLSAALGDSEE